MSTVELLETQLSAAQPSSAVQPETNALQKHSCALCQQRKVKCDRREPCANCTKAQTECIFREPAPVRRRKRKAPETDPHTMIARYEAILKRLGVNLDALDSESEHNNALEESGRLAQVAATRGASKPERANGNAFANTGRLIVREGRSRYLENNLWTGLNDEMNIVETSDSRQLQSQTSDGEHSVHDAGNLLDVTGPDLFFDSHQRMNVRPVHPPPADILRLWQVYLDNVEPLLKILHVPTVEQFITKASNDLDSISKPMEALIFSIYACAINSMSDADCRSVFGEPKMVLFGKYNAAAKQALLGTEFLKSSELVVLQAFVMSLLSMRDYCDPRSLWIFTGVAVRCGQRMGLHRDGTSLKLSPFDTEMRRRLWWQIVIVDSRTAELAGAGVSVMANLWDTRMPLNINDSDLTPDMQQLPTERAGATEMMFCLLRNNIGHLLRHTGSTNLFDGAWQTLSSSTVPLVERDAAIDNVEGLIQDKFLRYCDPAIPLHLMTSIVSRAAIASMRLVAHHPRQYSDRGAHLGQGEKEMLFATSLKVIELDNLAHSTKSIQRFLWHTSNFFQWHAFVYLLSELCIRTAGGLVDKAWEQVDEALKHHFEHIDATVNSLYAAVRSLVIRAWQARAVDLVRQHQIVLQPLPFVAKLLTGRAAANAQLLGDHSGESAEQRAAGGAESSRLSQTSTAACGDFDPTFSIDYLPSELGPIDWAEWDAMLQDVDVLAFQSGGNPL